MAGWAFRLLDDGLSISPSSSAFRTHPPDERCYPRGRHMEGMASGILHLLSGDWVKLIDDFSQMEVINAPFFIWDYKVNKWNAITPEEFRAAFIKTMEVCQHHPTPETSVRTSLSLTLAASSLNHRTECGVVGRGWVRTCRAARRSESCSWSWGNWPSTINSRAQRTTCW